MIKLVSLKLRNFKQYEIASINFPDQGRILIKGRNEAGKSSIFEAIFFALFGDTLYLATMGDLIRFGSNESIVELTVKTNDKLITIRRILSLNKTQDASLVIKNINEQSTKQEIVKGVKNVNSRIVKEIGLDKDILLNTCLIAQKKLDTLESLNAGDRRKIISKLFNLDYLLNISEKAKQIKNELENQKPQYELLKKAGEAKRVLPEIEKELEKIHREMERIEKIEKSKNIYNLEETLNNLNEEIRGLEQNLENLKNKVETLEFLRDEKRKIEEIISIKEKLQILENQKEKLQKEITNLEERITKEKELLDQLEELNNIIKIKQEIEKLDKVLSDGNNLLSNFQERFTKYKDLESKTLKEKELLKEKEKLQKEEENLLLKKSLLELRVKKLRDILGKIQEIPKLEDTYKRTLEYHQQKNKVYELISKVQKTKNYFLTSSFITALSLILATLLSKIFFIITGLSTILSIYFYQNYKKINKEFTKAKNLQEYIEKDIPLELREKNQEELASILNKIQKKKTYKNEQIERLEEKLKIKLNQINNLITDLAQKKAYIESELKNIDSYKNEMHKLLLEFQEKLKESTLNKIEDKLKKLSDTLKKKEEELISLREKDTMPDKELSYLISQKGSIENEIENIRRLKEEVERKRRDYQNMENEILKEKTNLEVKMKELKRNDDEYLSEIEEIIKQLENEKVKEEYEKFSQELNKKKGEKNSIEKNYLDLINEFSKRFVGEDWRNYINEVMDENLKEELITKEKELLQQKGEKEGILKEYELKTGNKREDLDPERINQEYNKLEKEITKMNYAMKIVDTTRETILKAIRPRTESFMQKILPILTSDRYHYVEIGDDYKLKVYTSLKKEPLEKTIFSGGTQDQLSLALRLAFAMATLPQDKGIQPKFIFLDEPLGSFDEDRAKGLLYLLTEGEVAEHFDQIFVVTHIPIDESIFDEIYYVENGKITKVQENTTQSLDYEDIS